MRLEPGDVEMVRWCEVDTFCEVGGDGGKLSQNLLFSSTTFQSSMLLSLRPEGSWQMIAEH